MKATYYILIIIIGFSSCNSSITGLYKHEICGNAPDCFLYDFCKNGRFTYWYSQDILGSATLTGDWFRKGDTLILKADQYLFRTETKLVCNRNDSLAFTRIQIGLIQKYFKGHKDTTWLNWLVKIDSENKVYETDNNGILKIPYRPIKQITVRDYFTRFGIAPLIEMKDSVFQISNNSNDIKIYIADNKSEPIILWADKKMIVKWRKIVSIIPDSLKNSRPEKYIRVKKECGNIKIQ